MESSEKKGSDFGSAYVANRVASEAPYWGVAEVKTATGAAGNMLVCAVTEVKVKQKKEEKKHLFRSIVTLLMMS